MTVKPDEPVKSPVLAIFFSSNAIAEKDSDTDVKSLTGNRRFAFYINAYNAVTIKLILTKFPGMNSIKEISASNPLLFIRQYTSKELKGKLNLEKTVLSSDICMMTGL